MLLPITLLITFAIGSVVAEDMATHYGQHAMNHTGQPSESQPLPTEAGEAGFAAITEIVTVLSNDPTTDWSKVDINGLREHLVLMNKLVLGAIVVEQAVESRLRFTVIGHEGALASIRQMVPAYAIELNKMAEFTATTTLIDQGIVIEVLGKNSATNDRLKGLGFFG